MVLLKNDYNRWVAHRYFCGLLGVPTIQIPQAICQVYRWILGVATLGYSFVRWFVIACDKGRRVKP
jgi:hypothetical protein